MVETAWLVETLGEMLGDGERARRLIEAYAAAAGHGAGGMLEDQSAFAILDAVKAGESGLPATAASTLKVRIMMLLSVRGSLTV